MSLVHNEGYSAAVDIRLFVNDVCFDVAQVGDSSLILSETSPLPPLESGQLVVTVDGEEFAYPIQLCNITGRMVSFF